MKPTIVLLDVDGVLVQPGGYRAAVQAAVNYFTRQMGFGDLAPDHDTIAIFEAQGITCEWDMVPLLLAMVLDSARSGQAAPAGAWDSIQEALDGLQRQPVERPRLDFPAAIRALAPYVKVGSAPADAILAACQNDPATGPFPRLAGQGVLRQLFSHTRRPQQSLTTDVFTTFVLGDQVYARDMGQHPRFASESLLARHDRALLAPEWAERINTALMQKRLHMAAYTARPSIPEDGMETVLAVYSPEAEMALRQAGLQGVVVMGSGQMSAAAVRMGENEDRLTKPAPYHAIAAAAAALTGHRGAALEWASAVFRWLEQGAPPPSLETRAGRLPVSINLHIFEDSPSGMQGGIAAVDLLARLGMQVDLRLWGVTAHPEKLAALERLGASVYPDINTALAVSNLLAVEEQP